MHPKLIRFSNYALLALLIYMPVFGFLDTLPIRIWDEARIAINAYEMHKDGDLIVTHFQSQPEMWNTKPPLLIWMQVFLMKTIGVNELAIRLPSAFAAFGTCLALLFFSIRYLKKFWLGFIAVLTLITCDAYIHMHLARTGDYDALLTLFTTLGSLLFYSYCETKKTKYLYLFFLSLTLAVLTKGVAGLLFTPALGIYCLLQKQVVPLLKNKHFYTGLISFLVIAIGYYLLREWKNPGYIAIIQENELGGRFLVSQGNQKFNFWFYYENFINYRLSDRYLLVPAGIILGIASKDARIRKFALFILLIAVTYFLIVSTAKTKLEWYDAPLFPFLSFAIAFFVNFVFELIKNSSKINETINYNALGLVFLFLVFYTPYHKIFLKTYQPTEYSWETEFYRIGHYLKASIAGKHDLNGKAIVYDGYDLQHLFYVHILNDKGVNLSRKSIRDLKTGDQIIACQDTIKNHIKKYFNYKELEKYHSVVTYQLIEARDPEAEAQMKPALDSLSSKPKLGSNK